MVQSNTLNTYTLNTKTLITRSMLPVPSKSFFETTKENTENSNFRQTLIAVLRLTRSNFSKFWLKMMLLATPSNYKSQNRVPIICRFWRNGRGKIAQLITSKLFVQTSKFFLHCDPRLFNNVLTLCSNQTMKSWCDFTAFVAYERTPSFAVFDETAAAKSLSS